MNEIKLFRAFKNKWAKEKDIDDVNNWYEYLSWCKSNGFDESEIGYDNLVVDYIEFKKTMSLKTSTIVIETYKDTSIGEVAYELYFDKFKNENPNLDENELSDKFYTEVVSKMFEYGEFIHKMEIEIDENLNIISGKLIPYKK